MRILIAVDTMTIGGTEKLTANLAEHFVKNGHDCPLLVLKDDFASTTYLNRYVKVYAALRSFKPDLSYISKVGQVVSELRPDVILCQALFAYFSVKLATLFHPRIATFLALHYTYNTNLKDEIFDFVYYNLIKLWPDDIITIYDEQAKYFSKKYHIPLKRFHCIHNGIDSDFYKHQKKNKSSVFNIIHIGNIREEKDQLTLLKALRIFDDRFKNWQLVFCGKDQMGGKQRLVDYLSDTDLLEKVEFIERVDDVRTLLRAADVFVLSSVSEALPMSALEAMSMEVPCILTDVGGCPEIVDDGVNGFIVESRNPTAIADRLLVLARDRHLLKQMRHKAREKIVAAFSEKSMVDAYLRLFNSALRKELLC